MHIIIGLCTVIKRNHSDYHIQSTLGTMAGRKSGDYSRLPPADGEDDWLRRQVREHREQVQEQDQHLDEIGRGVERLGEISLTISRELDGQNKMLTSMDTEFETAIDRLDIVTKKTKELINKSGGVRNFCIILALVAILMFLIMLVLYT